MNQSELRPATPAGRQQDKYRRQIMAGMMGHERQAVKTPDINDGIDRCLTTLNAHFPGLGKKIRSDAVIKTLTALPIVALDFPIVSLDFFDTLVVRQVDPPEHIHAKVAEISCDLLSALLHVNLNESYYLQLRQTAEREQREKNQQQAAKDHETTLRDIIADLLARLGLTDPALCDRLVSLEADLERDTLTLNTGALALLQTLKIQDKRVIVVSDMYLAGADIQRIAAHLGIDEYIDAYYVSGDIGCAKYSGKLFDYVIHAESTQAEKIIHTGDNYHSDYVAARQAGVAACWFLQKENLSRRRAVRQAISRHPGRFITRAIQRAGETAAHRPAIDKAFYEVISPVVFSQVYKSIKDGIRLGVRQFYFLAREGVAFRQACDLLIQFHPEFRQLDITTRTLYISRASSVCARYTHIRDVKTIIATVYERFGEISYANLLKAWSVSEQELGYQPEQPPRLHSEADLCDLFSCQAFSEKFDACLTAKKRHLHQYLQQQGVFREACFFVDVGWGGTIQKNVQQLEPQSEIYGCYTGTNERFGLNTLRGYLFQEGDKHTRLIIKCAPLLEEMLSCESTGSAVGYARVGERIEPVFSHDNRPRSALEVTREAAFTEFLAVFITLTRDYACTTEMLIDQAKEQLYRFLACPDRRFLQAIVHLEFQYNWGDSQSHRLVRPVSAQCLLRPGLFRRDVIASPWCFGTLKISGLGFLNPVMRLAARLSPQTRQRLSRLPVKLLRLFRR